MIFGFRFHQQTCKKDWRWERKLFYLSFGALILDKMKEVSNIKSSAEKIAMKSYEDIFRPTDPNTQQVNANTIPLEQLSRYFIVKFENT